MGNFSTDKLVGKDSLLAGRCCPSKKERRCCGSSSSHVNGVRGSDLESCKRQLAGKASLPQALESWSVKTSLDLARTGQVFHTLLPMAPPVKPRNTKKQR